MQRLNVFSMLFSFWTISQRSLSTSEASSLTSGMDIDDRSAGPKVVPIVT